MLSETTGVLKTQRLGQIRLPEVNFPENETRRITPVASCRSVKSNYVSRDVLP